MGLTRDNISLSQKIYWNELLQEHMYLRNCLLKLNCKGADSQIDDFKEKWMQIEDTRLQKRVS